MKKYLVTLTEDERAALGQRVATGSRPARELTHARILLKADQGPHGPAWSDTVIAAALDVSVSTVERVRKRFARAGLETALRHRRPRRDYRRRLDGEQEAHLIALACSPPPLGRRFWTLRLLADRMVELRFVDGLSYETVRRLLKKNELKPWLTERWCIPPEGSGAFVWRMEDVLEVYTRPYDPKRPQVCMDEVSKQLLVDKRGPLSARRGRGKRVDYEYERRGTANLFLCCEPLTGRRSVRVTERRTRLDWAHCIKDLLDNRYPDAEKVVLVLDNLNTHSPGSLYEAFPPAEAKRLADKLEIHSTPKHGSWLNMAELELSVLSRQCLDRRIPDRKTLEQEVAAWEAERNTLGGRVDWRFATADARIKLKRLYPSIDV
jgi:transposase